MDKPITTVCQHNLSTCQHNVSICQHIVSTKIAHVPACSGLFRGVPLLLQIVTILLLMVSCNALPGKPVIILASEREPFSWENNTFDNGLWTEAPTGNFTENKTYYTLGSSSSNLNCGKDVICYFTQNTSCNYNDEGCNLQPNYGTGMLCSLSAYVNLVNYNSRALTTTSPLEISIDYNDLSSGDGILCLADCYNPEITIHYYGLSVPAVYCSSTTTTEGTTTSTSEGTTTTGGATTTTGGVTTTSGGVTTSTDGGSTTLYTPSTLPAYGYTIPNNNHGTLPSLNGTGGNTINNGSLKNMPCTGWCIIGLNKDEFLLYASIMITIIVLISIKPFKLGATASAISLSFFNGVVGFTNITASLMLIFWFLATMAWFTGWGE